ncbi:MAG: hypothetical protein AVO39_07100 [delta proteobacterium MLS_D]|nr:MAG: hypothetical protein AVO39_07100 [delta proteobacterium MLS_D]
MKPIMCKTSPTVKNNQGLSAAVPAQNKNPALFKKKLIDQYPGPTSPPAAFRKNNMPKPMQINIVANPRKEPDSDAKIIIIYSNQNP